MIVAVAAANPERTRMYFLCKPARHCNLFAEFNNDLDVIQGYKARGLQSFEGKGLPSNIIRHWEQGFMDDQGTFLDRKAAAEHALQCGQISKLNWPPDLYSEDLW